MGHFSQLQNGDARNAEGRAGNGSTRQRVDVGKEERDDECEQAHPGIVEELRREPERHVGRAAF